MKKIMPYNSLPEKFKREGSKGWIDYYRELMKAISSGILKEEPTDTLQVKYDDRGEIHNTTLGYIKARCFDQILEELKKDKENYLQDKKQAALAPGNAAPFMRRRLIDYIENTLL